MRLIIIFLGASLGGVLGAVIVALINSFLNKPIVMNSEHWISCKDIPINKNHRDIIVTDGKKVEYQYLTRFNHEKIAVMGYNNITLVRYWRPMPKPPDDLS